MPQRRLHGPHQRRRPHHLTLKERTTMTITHEHRPKTQTAMHTPGLTSSAVNAAATAATLFTLKYDQHATLTTLRGLIRDLDALREAFDAPIADGTDYPKHQTQLGTAHWAI
jgi:hypothetical protein